MSTAAASPASAFVHRLILMVATEADPARLRRRLDDDVALLREAVGLYAGLRQPGGATAGRVERICQSYDIELSTFVRGLRFMVKGPAGVDAAEPDLPIAFGPESPSLPPQALTAPSAPEPPPDSLARVPAGVRLWRSSRRTILLGGGAIALLAATLALAAQGNGPKAPAALPVSLAARPLVAMSDPPSDPAAAPVRGIGKTGEHWAKLAQLAGHGAARMGSSRADDRGAEPATVAIAGVPSPGEQDPAHGQP